MKKIARGAEAVISRDREFLVKERIRKAYRLRQIDEKLRERRTKQEARLMREARRAGVLTPQITGEDKFKIRMEFIDGPRVKDILNPENCGEIAEKIGKCVALLHTYNIIHGDLTTSNTIMRGGELYFIDFGLGVFSQRAEDKATDLHLLHEAIESTHFDVLGKTWRTFIESYRKNYPESEKVIKALAKIEKRGRYVER